MLYAIKQLSRIVHHRNVHHHNRLFRPPPCKRTILSRALLRLNLVSIRGGIRLIRENGSG